MQVDIVRHARLTALAAAAFSMLVLGGCMSFIPAYERPAAPVAPAYSPELTPAGAPGSVPAADIEWQRFFADPRLKRLIELSLQNNRDLRVAILNIEQARASYQIRRADELPSIGAGVNAQRQAAGSGGLVNIWAVGLQVTSYELDFFGRVRSLSQAALAQYLATEEARKTTQISLVASVATTYIGLLADDESLRVTRETLTTREDSFRLTKLRFDNGASSEVDVRQAEQLLETAKASLAQTQRQRALDENALTLLVGQALPVDLPAPVAAGQLPRAAISSGVGSAGSAVGEPPSTAGVGELAGGVELDSQPARTDVARRREARHVYDRRILELLGCCARSGASNRRLQPMYRVN